MPEFKLPPRAASVSDLLEAATAVFRRTLAKGLPVAMFAILLWDLPSLYWLTRGKQPDLMHPPHDGTFILLGVIGFVSYQVLAGVLMLRQRALLAGTLPDLGREFAALRTRWPLLPASALLMWILVFVGLRALVLPGIVVLVCLLVLRPVVLFEQVNPLQALQRSFRLAWPLWLKHFASALIAALVFFVCTIAAVACLGILQSVLMEVGLEAELMRAIAAACVLGIQSVALVYFNALWLVLYSAANSSA